MANKGAVTESVFPLPDGEGRILDVTSYILLWLATAVFLGYFFVGASLVPPIGTLNLFQAILVIVIAKIIVMAFFALNGVPGWKYGIPMVVQMRASFGTRGQAIPSLIRAVPALFWFGVQTWVGAQALNGISKELFGFDNTFVWFVVFQLVQTWIASRGFSSIKWFDVAGSIFIAVCMVYIMYRLISNYGAEMSKIMDAPGTYGWAFWGGVTTMLGIYSTLMLNVSDLVRYMPRKGVSKTRYTLAQLLGILPGALFMCMIGIISVSTTGQYDPIAIFVKEIPSLGLMVVMMLFIAAAQFTTNLVGNVVPPTMVLCDLFKVKWRTGAWITGILGLFTFPWLLLTANAFNLFVQIYSAFLGPILGVMLADFFLLRSQKYHLAELYNPRGFYSYCKGFNPAAFIAIIAGAVIATIKVEISWFLGLIPSAILYVILMKAWIVKKYPQSIPAEDQPEQEIIKAVQSVQASVPSP
ncbi:NCS1 family transporter [Brevibacillus sp. B_LB10_24]|uniref:NCS1 family transporter n=1 Tax=Brevibacillus sp. B_LB10_24 TaxID=3380645 RepID=UPI0038BD17FD